jgi:hypothetical protein
MMTTNLESLYGLKSERLGNDFIAYQGGNMVSMGGSRVVAFGTPDGVAVF